MLPTVVEASASDLFVGIASDVDERINPLVAKADEREEIRAFLYAGGRDAQADQIQGNRE